MDTIAISDTELEAMFALEIPCRSCKGPATLMSRGHRCRPPGYRTFLCGQCHLAWSIAVEMDIETKGFVSHHCGAMEVRVCDFSDYRKM